LQGIGFSLLQAELTDAGIGLAAGGASFMQWASSFAAHSADPLAQGLSSLQILNRIDQGARALNNADFTALGGFTTSALAKADMLARGIDISGDAYTLTTGLFEGFAKSINLANTGLTPSGNFLTGGLSMLGSAANGGFVLYPNKSNTNMMKSIYAK